MQNQKWNSYVRKVYLRARRMTAEPGDLFIEHLEENSAVLRFLLLFIDLTAEMYTFACVVLYTSDGACEITNETATQQLTRILFDTPKHAVSEI